MTPLRRFAVAAYVVAAVLVLFTALDMLQAAWPLDVGLVNWRVLVIGALARILAMPLLGLVLAYGAALILEQPRVLRTLAIVNVAMAAIIPVGLVFYALDVLQLRDQVVAGDRSRYDMGIFVSFSRYGLGFLALLGMAWGEWGAARAMRVTRGPEQVEEAAAGLVFQAAGKTESPSTEESA